MTEQEEILVDLLVKADTLFRPWRGPWGSTATAIYEARRDYLKHGLAWASEASTESGRKAGQRELESLVRSKLVDACKRQGRTAWVRLSIRGEQTARMLTGVFRHDEAKPLFAMLQEFAPESVNYTVGPDWVPETRLIGMDWGTKESTAKLGELQMRMVPLTTLGWVESHATTHRHVWYRILPRGHIADGTPIAWELLPDLPDFDQDAAEYHDEHFDQALSKWATRQPDDPNDIWPIPFSCSWATHMNVGKGYVDGIFGAPDADPPPDRKNRTAEEAFQQAKRLRGDHA